MSKRMILGNAWMFRILTLVIEPRPLIRFEAMKARPQASSQVYRGRAGSSILAWVASVASTDFRALSTCLLSATDPNESRSMQTTRSICSGNMAAYQSPTPPPMLWPNTAARSQPRCSNTRRKWTKASESLYCSPGG